LFSLPFEDDRFALTNLRPYEERGPDFLKADSAAFDSDGITLIPGIRLPGETRRRTPAASV